MMMLIMRTRRPWLMCSSFVREYAWQRS